MSSGTFPSRLLSFDVIYFCTLCLLIFMQILIDIKKYFQEVNTLCDITIPEVNLDFDNVVHVALFCSNRAAFFNLCIE